MEYGTNQDVKFPNTEFDYYFDLNLCGDYNVSGSFLTFHEFAGNSDWRDIRNNCDTNRQGISFKFFSIWKLPHVSVSLIETFVPRRGVRSAQLSPLSTRLTEEMISD